MTVTVLAVGSPGRLLGPAIQDYEERAARYWKLEARTVDPEKATKNRAVDDVMAAEADRLTAATPDRSEVVALTRTGKHWSSRDLARYLNQLAVRGSEGATFVIGGAYGLHPRFVREAQRRLSLSSMTLPHDLARLVLAEQLYRAGTIVRREPYHKG
ncbi:MAG: 23S rRNA (pseudouridine(1915)-N(3))-methyltransferase RlmH [Longimicrobiales bacterium]|nr:23S rRNA (pseudouridine(1915)-N(3))-methyltransferase RlmH [Longimicrobiales bacterium]